LKKIVVALFCAVVTMFANDGFGALGAGGIIVGKTNDIAMAKEVLDISYDKIKVDYEFANESDKDITETIVFPLPPIAVGEKVFKDHAPYLGIIDGFKVFVDGKAVKFKTKVRAVSSINGEDITDKLRKIGFSEYDIIMAEDKFDEIVMPKTEVLKANGLWSNDSVLWASYVTYEWVQTFKKHAKLHVSHSYFPLISGGKDGSYTRDSDGVIQDYCISQEAKKKLDAAYNNQGYALWGTVVEYVLKTANTWKDGIRDFTLIVRTKLSKEIVSTCYPKNLQQVSDNTYQLKLKNFKPKQDLKIYFGNRQ
jgi:hypothetical protein